MTDTLQKKSSIFDVPILTRQKISDVVKLPRQQFSDAPKLVRQKLIFCRSKLERQNFLSCKAGTTEFSVVLS